LGVRYTKENVALDQTSEDIQRTWAWLIAALIAISMPLLNLWLTKRRAQKAFSWRVLMDAPLVTKKEGTEKVEVLYAGQPVENLHLLRVEFRNSGGKEIEAKDFAEPCRLTFPPNTSLFDPVVVDTVPEDFAPEIEHDGATVTLKPTLMNSGDRVTVQCLVASDHPVQPKVSARISGVRRPTKFARWKPVSPVARAISVCSLVSFILFAILFATIRELDYELDAARSGNSTLVSKHEKKYGQALKVAALLKKIEHLTDARDVRTLEVAKSRLAAIRKEAHITLDLSPTYDGYGGGGGYEEPPAVSLIVILTLITLSGFVWRAFTRKDVNEDDGE
jgi:hypothetical protein